MTGAPARRRGAPAVGVVVLRVLLAAAGLAAIGYGIDGLVARPRATNPPQAASWLIGGILVHDLLVVPVTAVVGFLLTRGVPAPYRAVLQGALLVSAAVVLAFLPLWRGYGGSPGNPSVNPLPYGRNLTIVLGAVWTGAAVLIVFRVVSARRGRAWERTGPDPGRSAARIRNCPARRSGGSRRQFDEHPTGGLSSPAARASSRAGSPADTDVAVRRHKRRPAPFDGQRAEDVPAQRQRAGTAGQMHRERCHVDAERGHAARREGGGQPAGTGPTQPG